MSFSTVAITTANTGIDHADNITPGSLEAANQLLQHNHDKWHVMWDTVKAGGLHNHQVHYLLTDLALGASPEQIKIAFESNKGYQREIDAGDEKSKHVITSENFEEYLAHYEYYAPWLDFFQNEINQKGWQAVLGEYLFDETPRANDLLGRMFEGAIHPIIHLGFGVEFAQPAIIAEALAQAAIHRSQATSYLLRTQELASNHPAWTREKRLMDIFTAVRSNPFIKDAPVFAPGSWDRMGNFFPDLPQPLVEVAASYTLDRSMGEDEVQLRTAEMIDVITWMASACQNPAKAAKFDFFLMHSVNCSIFLSVFARLDFLDEHTKFRLLEFKVRMGLVMYATQGFPELLTDEITTYKPRRGDQCMNWTEVIERAKNIPCDGHVVKFIRALHHGSIVCRPYEDSKDETIASKFPIKGTEMWLKIANMVLDSTEDYPGTYDKWMRGPGFDAAWDIVPDRK
ncbi:hypothetical protein LTS17_011722 [Exophiala oligosperma]